MSVRLVNDDRSDGAEIAHRGRGVEIESGCATQGLLYEGDALNKSGAERVEAGDEIQGGGLGRAEAGNQLRTSVDCGERSVAGVLERERPLLPALHKDGDGPCAGREAAVRREQGGTHQAHGQGDPFSNRLNGRDPDAAEEDSGAGNRGGSGAMPRLTTTRRPGNPLQTTGDVMVPETVVALTIMNALPKEPKEYFINLSHWFNKEGGVGVNVAEATARALCKVADG